MTKRKFRPLAFKNWQIVSKSFQMKVTDNQETNEAFLSKPQK